MADENSFSSNGPGNAPAENANVPMEKGNLPVGNGNTPVENESANLAGSATPLVSGEPKFADSRNLEETRNSAESVKPEREPAQRPVVHNSNFGGIFPPPAPTRKVETAVVQEPPANPTPVVASVSAAPAAPTSTPPQLHNTTQSGPGSGEQLLQTQPLSGPSWQSVPAQPNQGTFRDGAQSQQTSFPGVMPSTILTEPAPAKKKRGPGWLALISAVLIATILGGALGVGVMTLRYDGTRPAALPTSEAKIAPVVDAVGDTPDWEAVATAVGPSVVSIQVRSANAQGSGSGVIIDQKGYVLTNEHVISGAQNITVTLSDGRLYNAEIMGEDASTDLAVIKMQNPPENLSVAALGDSNELKVGQAVTAIGNPLGLSSTMTTGIISALNRPVVTSGAEEVGAQQAAVVTNAVQVDAAINPGNSGGPIFDAQGRVVAIASSIASTSSINGSTAGNIGIGFGIPINLAKNISAQLIENGVAEHAYLGVRISDGVAEYGADSRLGAVVRTVEPGTPAAAAKLQPEDVIVAVNGKDVVSGVSLTGYIRQYKSGDKVTLVIARNGELQELDVTLQTRKDQ